MTHYTYPKENRLLKPVEFKTVFNQPVFKIHHTHLMAFVSNTQHNQARLGMAITKKKLPKAVARNQVKRIIKEQFRHQRTQLPNLDIVFILKKPTLHLTNQQLKAEVQTILGKVIAKHGNEHCERIK